MIRYCAGIGRDCGIFRGCCTGSGNGRDAVGYKIAVACTAACSRRGKRHDAARHAEVHGIAQGIRANGSVFSHAVDTGAAAVRYAACTLNKLKIDRTAAMQRDA